MNLYKMGDQKIKVKTDKIVNYYNKNTKILKPIIVEEKVLFKLVPNGPWINGKIIQTGKYPRSYIVQDEKGGNYRRNRKHLIAYSLTTSNPIIMNLIHKYIT